MKSTIAPINYLLFVTGIAASSMSLAFDAQSTQTQANHAISALYHRLNSKPNTSMADRIDWFSAQLKGQPYVLGALGEGASARYDQYPKYRMEGFDCDTYVNTVLALALANSLPSFEQCMQYTRYHQGKISYLQRNHFTSIDWNQNNQKRGMLQDITLTIQDQHHKPVARIATAQINKAGWYAHKNTSTIRLEKSNPDEQAKRLVELKKKGSQFKTVTSNLPYLPLTALFTKNQQANLYLFKQIPHGAIVEIVRPNWDLRKSIGTALNISHLGFAIWKHDQLYFRQASSELHGVVDVSMIDYLKKALSSPTIKGINVQVLLPTKPVTDCRKLNT